jgi:hypothetical protein
MNKLDIDARSIIKLILYKSGGAHLNGTLVLMLSAAFGSANGRPSHGEQNTSGTPERALSTSVKLDKLPTQSSNFGT